MSVNGFEAGDCSSQRELIESCPCTQTQFARLMPNRARLHPRAEVRRYLRQALACPPIFHPFQYRVFRLYPRAVKFLRLRASEALLRACLFGGLLFREALFHREALRPFIKSEARGDNSRHGSCRIFTRSAVFNNARYDDLRIVIRCKCRQNSIVV